MSKKVFFMILGGILTQKLPFLMLKLVSYAKEEEKIFTSGTHKMKQMGSGFCMIPKCMP
jgi:hypothetical protein